MQANETNDDTSDTESSLSGTTRNSILLFNNGNADEALSIAL